MRLLSDIVESIRQVCRYEKTVRVDTKALQSVMMIFVLVMLLIDIENFKLGKYIIGGVTLAVAVMSIVLVIVLKYIKNVYRICQAAVVVFFILAVIISIEGTNDGFSLLWFLLLPVITLVLLGMPFGAPVCIFFGLYITVLFWTPLNNMLIYNYTRDYLFYYPIFYWGFCLLVVAMDIFYKLYQIRQADNEKNLEAEVLEAVEGTKKLMIDAVTAISQMLDEKDVYTQEHSKRAAEYSKLIAKNLKAHEFTDEEISLIYRSAFLHDIGKIAVPDAVLNKPAKLTDEEYGIMKNHTVWGGQILSGLEFLPQADMGAVYHHERYDGKGYPDGLKGDEIPISAQVVSLADVYDALVSERVYKKAYSHEKAIEMITNGECGCFNPILLECLLDIQDRIKRKMKTGTPEDNPFKKREKKAELKEFENVKEDFMDVVSKNMEKEYSNFENDELVDFSRGGQNPDSE